MGFRIGLGKSVRACWIVFFTGLLFSGFLYAEPIGNALSNTPTSDRLRQFVRISADKEVFVDWDYAKPGSPTVILLNGLTYSTRNWDKLRDSLLAVGIGVLRYDMAGHGQTLLKYAPITEEVTGEQQAQDLNALLNVLKVKGPLNLVGLSYGGAIGMIYSQLFPEQVGRLILMAPFTAPLEDQDQWIRSQIWYTRKVFPFNPASDDELYDYFLRKAVYSVYPSAEPSILENPYKLESTFRLVQGVRKWRAADAIPSFPSGSVHLMIAGSDQYIRRQVMMDFWDSVPPTARGSMVVIQNSEHKIPEAVPKFAAAWIQEILRPNRVVSGGRNFTADPYTGLVEYDGGKLRLPKER